MIDDPAVRSVRIAVALCDRFVELLKGPSQVTARKQEGALVGFSGNQEELSLRIGEAQQLYPEIWRHLDDARTVFAARGIEVAGFDALRAEEGQGLGAAVDVDYKKQGVGQHAIHMHTKAANFNQAGLQRARKACNVLMHATPEIDWAGIAKAETNDPAAAAFGRATRQKRMIQFGILGLVIATPFLIIMYMQHEEHAKIEGRRANDNERVAVQTQPLSDAERSELMAAVAPLRASVMTARSHWATASGPEGLNALVPGTRPCAPAVHEPASDAADKYIRSADVDATAFESSAFRAYIAPVKELPDGELRHAENLLAQLESRVATGKADATDRARLADLNLYSTTVIIDKETKPEILQTAPKIAYKPGELTARAYVFSLKDGKFICAANIAVRNTPSEDSPKFLDGVRRALDAEERLHRELEVRIRQALATNLKSTEP